MADQSKYCAASLFLRKLSLRASAALPQLLLLAEPVANLTGIFAGMNESATLLKAAAIELDARREGLARQAEALRAAIFHVNLNDLLSAAEQLRTLNSEIDISRLTNFTIDLLTFLRWAPDVSSRVATFDARSVERAAEKKQVGDAIDSMDGWLDVKGTYAPLHEVETFLKRGAGIDVFINDPQVAGLSQALTVL